MPLVEVRRPLFQKETEKRPKLARTVLSLTYWSATRPHNLQALPIDERLIVAGVVRVISLNAVGSKIGGKECLIPDTAISPT